MAESPFGFYADLSDDEDRPTKVSFEKVTKPKRYTSHLFSPGDGKSSDVLNLSIGSITSDTSECSRFRTDIELRPFKARLLRVFTLVFAIAFVFALAYIDYSNDFWLQRTVGTYLFRRPIRDDF